MSSFRDTSVKCGICWSPLDEEEVIELSCGHRWHLRCIKEQLEHAKPSTARRLLFNGCRCAKCGVFCDHPQLEQLTRNIDHLREKVDQLIVDQLQVDAPHEWKRAITNGGNTSILMDEGRRKYGFFLCSCCEEPYFGGTVDCADQQQQQEEEHGGGGGGGELEPKARFCVACAPQLQRACTNPTQHRGHFIWKCRYCCQPSTFVCYGNVHFCDSCHERNSQRIQRRRNETTPPLKPISCSGQSCLFPKPEGQTFHNNGSNLDCEQMYFCAVCDSDSGRRQSSMAVEEGSENLIMNPSGQQGIRFWRQKIRPHDGAWAVEACGVPPNDHTSTNFVSCHRWCSMAQFVRLHYYVRDPSTVRFEISALYMARTDCPSVFKMDVVILDRNKQPLHRESTSIFEAPVDYWEKVRLVVGPIPHASHVVMIISGKDSRNWAGRYGSKVTNCSIRVLGNEEEVAWQLLPRRRQEQQRWLGFLVCLFECFFPIVVLFIAHVVVGMKLKELKLNTNTNTHTHTHTHRHGRTQTKKKST